jgi:hypothetical protein
MDELLTRVMQQSLQLIESATTPDELERVRVCMLGRKGILTLLLREIWQ